MTTAQRDTLLDQITERGQTIYAEELGTTLERQYLGQMVAIHPDSGHWEAAPSLDEAVRSLRQREPEGLLFTRRIGPPTASDLRLAARIALK